MQFTWEVVPENKWGREGGREWGSEMGQGYKLRKKLCHLSIQFHLLCLRAAPGVLTLSHQQGPRSGRKSHAEKQSCMGCRWNGKDRAKEDGQRTQEHVRDAQ